MATDQEIQKGDQPDIGPRIWLTTKTSKLPGALLEKSRAGASKVILDKDPFAVWVPSDQITLQQKGRAKMAEEVEAYSAEELKALKAPQLLEIADALEIEGREKMKKALLIENILEAQEELQDVDEDDEDEEDLFEEAVDTGEDEDEDDEEEDDEEEDLEEEDEAPEEDEDEEEEEEEEVKPKKTKKGRGVGAGPAVRKAKLEKVVPGKNPFKTSTQKGAIAEVVIKHETGTRESFIEALKKAGVRTKSGLERGINHRMNGALDSLEGEGWAIERDGPNTSYQQVISVWHPGAGQKKPKAAAYKPDQTDIDRTKKRSETGRRLAAQRQAKVEAKKKTATKKTEKTTAVKTGRKTRTKK